MTLGEKLIAAHDACRAVLRSNFYVTARVLAADLDRIARQYDLPRVQVEEIMARAMDQFDPPEKKYNEWAEA